MEKFEPKHFNLKTGQEVVVRSMTRSDVEKSLAFFKSFPHEEQNYFRTDVTKKANVIKRIDQMETGHVHRLVAECEGQIIGDGALELSLHEWEKHVGEIRVSISPPFRRQGLGVELTRELYFLAVAAKVEKIIVKVMRVQEEAKMICHKLGFHDETLLPDHLRDRNGITQDLVIMSCDIKELWKEMEDFMFLSDFHRNR